MFLSGFIDQFLLIDVWPGSGIKNLFFDRGVNLQFANGVPADLLLRVGVLGRLELFEKLLHIPMVLLQHLYCIRHVKPPWFWSLALR
jgi:hypothetical protein